METTFFHPSTSICMHAHIDTYLHTYIHVCVCVGACVHVCLPACICHLVTSRVFLLRHTPRSKAAPPPPPPNLPVGDDSMVPGAGTLTGVAGRCSGRGFSGAPGSSLLLAPCIVVGDWWHLAAWTKLTSDADKFSISSNRSVCLPKDVPCIGYGFLRRPADGRPGQAPWERDIGSGQQS